MPTSTRLTRRQPLLLSGSGSPSAPQSGSRTGSQAGGAQPPREKALRAGLIGPAARTARSCPATSGPQSTHHWGLGARVLEAAALSVEGVVGP